MTQPQPDQQGIAGPPKRRFLPPRRPAVAEKFEWRPSRDPAEAKRMYIRVGFYPEDGLPGEIFLRPAKRSGKWGSGLHRYADDVGETLSRHLQDGHTLDEMATWFKPGSLARFAVLAAQKIASEEDCRLPSADVVEIQPKEQG